MSVMNEFSSSVVLLPAYGRKYNTEHEAVADWKSGKDFKIVNGPYCSIRDLEKLQASSVWIDLITSLVRVE
jgi:hypothetical protein